MEMKEAIEYKERIFKLIFFTTIMIILVFIFNNMAKDYGPVTYDNFILRYEYKEEKDIQEYVDLSFEKIVVSDDLKKQYMYLVKFSGVTDSNEIILNEEQYNLIGAKASFQAQIDKYSFKYTEDFILTELSFEEIEINYRIPSLNVEKTNNIDKWKKDFLNEEYKEYKNKYQYVTENSSMLIVGVVITLEAICIISYVFIIIAEKKPRKKIKEVEK